LPAEITRYSRNKEQQGGGPPTEGNWME